MRFNTFILLKWAGLWLSLNLLNGCVSERCETKSDPVLRLAFARFTNAERTKEEALPVVFTKISAIGGKPDFNFIVESTAAITGIRLPLSHKEDATTFIFERNQLTRDEIVLTYTRKPYFISQACGFEMKFENITVLSNTSNNIAQVTITQPSVNAQINDVNVKIYFTR